MRNLICAAVAACGLAVLFACSGCSGDSGPANADAVKEMAKNQPQSNNPNVPAPTVDDSPRADAKGPKKK